MQVDLNSAKYKQAAGTGTCTDCSACGVGAEEATACVKAADRTCRCSAGHAALDEASNTCTACVDGSTFQTETGASTCEDCTACGDGATEATACTKTADRTCACSDGFEHFNGGSQSCSACEAGHFSNADTRAGGSDACQPWKNCPPGQGRVENSGGSSECFEAIKIL